MDLQKFMDKYLNKEEIKDLASEFDFKQSGTKKELIDRIISDPDFKLDDITSVLYKENVQDICEDLGLKVTGTKDDLWDSIVEKLGLGKKKTTGIPIKTVSTAKVKDFNSLTQVINEWIPSKRHKTEEGYQSDLRSFLEYKHNLVVKEEAGVTQVDILVEDRLPIEIKKNPSRGDFDRLSGQIDRNIEVYGNLTIVICQVQTRDLLNEYKNRSESRYSSEQLIWIIK